MRPKIAECVMPEDWKLLEQLRNIIGKLPENIVCSAFILETRVRRNIAEGRTIPNCHVIVRALAYFLPVIVHDGFVAEYAVEEKRGVAHHHSWLTRKGGSSSIIFDPWPLGVVSGPVLFIQGYGLRFNESPLEVHPRHKVEFTAHIAATRLAIRNVLKQ
jgi:hypothetical protein